MEKAIADDFFTQPDRHVPGLFRNGPTTATMNAGHLFHTNALKTRSLSDAMVLGPPAGAGICRLLSQVHARLREHAGGEHGKPAGRARIAADRGRVRTELRRLPGAAALSRPDRRLLQGRRYPRLRPERRRNTSATTKSSRSSTSSRRARATAFPTACSCPRAGPTSGWPAAA